MKLKKIASLALAGIMAVSMLAGCEGMQQRFFQPKIPMLSGTASSGHCNTAQKKLL